MLISASVNLCQEYHAYETGIFNCNSSFVTVQVVHPGTVHASTKADQFLTWINDSSSTLYPALYGNTIRVTYD